MKKRELKFRAWNKFHKEYEQPCYNITPDENYLFELFTGLKDKNGKEIYEGDIISDNGIEALGNVVFGEFEIGRDKDYNIPFINMGFAVKYYDGSGYSCINNSSESYGYESCKIEVIGNIHDNPKLLLKQR